ncbi:putative chromate transport protein [Oxobacter pfennigii]|uniref:Putative chromate transport protein n=1 Tax=Oxobacter pfennigii TaxID=36849 RepID=A0A0P8YS03_9CLOT|nr:chromate transporter [Oxobacter pfennigii]KPU42414.1 putative chromate transport protein [Oxobacter pfennigii]
MLEKIIDIFLTFLKIGAFTFGGGYAMIPFIQTEIVEIHKWLSPNEFIDILAIAEMTPGPIAVNSSTFVGYRVAGIAGALAGTIGVVMVCIILSTIAARYFFKFKDNKILKALFNGIRPAVIVLIASSIVSIGKVAFVDIKSILICIGIFLTLFKFKLNPIVAVLISGILGILLYF